MAKGPGPASGRGLTPAKKKREPSLAERREHEGRTPQPGVPAGPRNTQYPSASGYDYSPETYAKTGLTSPKTRAKRARKASQRKKALALTKKPAQKVKAKAPEPYKAPDISDLGKPLGDAIGAVADAVKTAKKVKDDAVVAAVKLPEKKVTKAFGKPTLGTPKVKELVKAKKEGRLSGVRRGKVVATPQARKAKKRLRRAQKVYAKKARPNIEGLLNEEQERFAEALSKETGLPPKLAGDWTLKESGASSAGAGGEAGEQNQLGVGYPAHPTAMSQSPYFNNTTPEKAAKATAEWMEGKIGSEYDYQAAPSIQEIPKLAKAGASDAELRAYIAGPSAWGTGEIPNSPQVTASPGKAGPKVTKRLKVAKKKAAKLGIKPTPTKGSVSTAPIPAKKRKGEWAGTKDILLKAARGIEITSEKRTPAKNAEVGGAEDSDHLTTNTNTFATDLPAEGAELNKIGTTVAKRLGVKSWSPGNYDWYTSAKYPGYRFQILSEVDGHFDHVHVGAEWTGEDLPAGTVLGGSTGTSSGGAVSVGGAAASEYATATGQSVEQVGQKMKQGKLSAQEIYEQLESLGVGTSPVGESSTSQSSAVLDELAKKYKVAA